MRPSPPPAGRGPPPEPSRHLAQVGQPQAVVKQADQPRGREPARDQQQQALQRGPQLVEGGHPIQPLRQLSGQYQELTPYSIDNRFGYIMVLP